MRETKLVLTLVVTAGLVLGCSEPTAPEGSVAESDVEPVDVTKTADEGGTTPESDTVDAGLDSAELPPVPGQQGDDCETDDACASGQCLGGTCTGADCDSCESPWACQAGACVPPVWYWCAPCVQTSDCTAGMVCQALAGDGASFCLPADCSAVGSHCPDGSACTETDDGGPSCVPADEICGCAPHHSGRIAACQSAEGCPGSRTCGDGVLAPCETAGPAAETCNGLDDDCNGVTDDGSAASQCDDGVPCTVDACEGGACTYGLGPDSCLIDGECIGEGAFESGDPCSRCDPGASEFTWTALGDDTACNDLDPCTVETTCQAGACVGSPKFCDTADPCTVGTCELGECVFELAEGKCALDGGTCASAGDQSPTDPCVTCQPEVSTIGWSPQTGLPCDDGDSCTLEDTCDSEGACVAGAPMECVPSADCAGSVCVEGACVETVDGASCLVEGKCYPAGVDEPGNPCRTCNPFQSKTSFTPANATCNDTKVCTLGDSCVDGECVGGLNVCDCFVDSDCNDGDPCNGVEWCDKTSGNLLQFACMPGEPVNCPVGEVTACGQTACNPVTGGCQLLPKPDGTPCDDDDPCTSPGACADGVCGIGDVVDCDDGNPCTADSCAGGICGFEPVDGPCDDGEACTTGEVCLDGECSGGEQLCACTEDSECEQSNPCAGYHVCNKDGDPADWFCELVDAPVECDPGVGGDCQANTCNADTGACELVALETGVPCDDGSVCTPDDVCVGGLCISEKKLSCEDGDPCTAAECDPIVGCTFAPLTGNPCDDGQQCTADDACLEGACLPGKSICACEADADCADGDLCNGIEICDTSGAPATWACKTKPGTVVSCSGKTQCTGEVCEPLSGTCKSVPSADGTACNDDDVCSHDDACAGGLCQGVAYECDDFKDCTIDACDGLGGCLTTVVGGTCLIDGTCRAKGELNPVNTCLWCDTAVPEGWSSTLAACSDGDPCTVGDVCDAQGGCVSDPPVLCDDGLACTTDQCDGLGGCTAALKTGSCLIEGTCYPAKAIHPKNPCLACDPAQNSEKWSFRDSICDDGDPCTLPGACSEGACAGQVPVSCDDGNGCTDDSCVDGKCSFSFNADPCDNGDKCPGDQCDGGLCKQANADCACAGGGDCDDDNPCNGVEFCAQGTCNSPGPVVCITAEVIPCQEYACHPAQGCTWMPKTGLPCDDGDDCTLADTCAAGVCEGGPPPDCDDGSPCTTDTCIDGVGCSSAPIIGHAEPCYEGADGTAGVGECKAGVATCDGAVLGPCDGQVLPESDVCDGKDNDCDGTEDEGFDLGAVCDGPDPDLCALGELQCNKVTGGVICVESESVLEICDDEDNDCDGTVDEGCDNDLDDWCDSQMKTVGTPAACPHGGGDCNDEEAAINPGADDVPELGFADSNCDGIDGDVSDAIFVSLTCGDDGNTGLVPGDPVATLDVAFALAAAHGRAQVLVDATQQPGASGESYACPGPLASGVGVYGGYRTLNAGGACTLSWTRDADADTRLETTVDLSDGLYDAVCIQAIDLTAPTTLQLLQIASFVSDGDSLPQSAPAMNTYGIYVRGGNLTVQASTIVAGAAGLGAEGGDGSGGPGGGGGSKGQNGKKGGWPETTDGGAGGTGCSSDGYGAGHFGGLGGWGGQRYSAGHGANGQNPWLGGLGGEDGWSWLPCSDWGYIQAPKSGGTGIKGAAGQAGTNAESGAGYVGLETDWFWRGIKGGHGTGAVAPPRPAAGSGPTGAAAAAAAAVAAAARLAAAALPGAAPSACSGSRSV